MPDENDTPRTGSRSTSARTGTPASATASGTIDPPAPAKPQDPARELTDDEREAEAERAQIMAGGDLLVNNRRQGMTLGTSARLDPNSPPGRTNYITSQITLLPGLQYVKPEEWLTYRSGWSERIASGEIGIVDIATTRRPDFTSMLANTGHVPTLRRLLEHEKREDIAKLIERAIADAESGAGKLRTSQSAHTPR